MAKQQCCGTCRFSGNIGQTPQLICEWPKFNPTVGPKWLAFACEFINFPEDTGHDCPCYEPKEPTNG